MEKKLLLVVLVVVGLCSTVALALDPMGPPTAGLKKGQWSAGIEWASSDMTVKRVMPRWFEPKHEADIPEMSKIYANIGYGFADNVEAFVRLGAGAADYERTTYSWDWEGSGDYRFTYGGGVKLTLAEQPGLKWGLLAQYSWGDFHGEKDDKWGTTPGSYNLKLDEMQIAIGPTWTPAENVSIYGGPFLHFIRGYTEDRQFNYDDSDVGRHPIKEDGWLGGYIGVQVGVAPNSTVNGEWMQTAEAKGFAVGLVWRQ